MQIEFTNNGDEDCVDLVVEIYPACGTYFLSLRSNRGNVLNRIGLESMLREDYGNTIESMLRRAYKQGWEDRGAKRRKKTQFAREMSETDIDVCW